MVDLTISVFKDAAEAADKLTVTLGRIVDLVASTASKGASLATWNAARSLDRTLRDVHARSIQLYVDQVARQHAEIEKFLKNPDPYMWTIIVSNLKETLKDTQILYRELENNDRELSTLPFFVGLSVSLAERERILISVVSISTPTSSEELESVGIFLEKYHGTTVQLLEFSKVLAEFVNESKNH